MRTLEGFSIHWDYDYLARIGIRADSRRRVEMSISKWKNWSSREHETFALLWKWVQVSQVENHQSTSL